MIRFALLCVIGLSLHKICFAQNQVFTGSNINTTIIESPDKSLKATVESDSSLGMSYHLEKNGKSFLESTRLGVTVDGTDLSAKTRFVSLKRSQIRRSYSFRGAHSTATENANAAVLEFQSGAQLWQIEAHTANDGFAFRYLVEGRGQRTVNGESTAFRLPPATRVWFGERDNAWKLQSYAGTWISSDIDAMPQISRQGPVQGAPLVFESPSGGYGVLCESAGFNYSGMRFRAIGERTFVADFTEGAKGFAIEGPIISPWRVVICANDLNELVNSTFVQNLAPSPDPKLFSDTSYIRTGRCVWRWQLRNTGSLTDQKIYVDSAVKLGYEFSLVDEGWESNWKPPMQQLAELCAYAKPQNVGIFVWKRWGEVSNPSENYATLRRWLDGVKDAGATGIKVDFFNSENLETRRGEERVLSEAAKRHLLVILHGCPKPTGEEICYPNLLTREAVRGLELNFMNEGLLSPTHNAALPFTRSVLGPTDYTPLTFTAKNRGTTTIAHQLATVLNIGSPLQVFTAFPEEMLNYPTPEVTDFLKAVPTVWDETRVLPESKIGDLAVLARRKKQDWFIAALNGNKARKYELKLDFLGLSPQNAILLRDDNTRSNITAENHRLKRDDSLTVDMAAGGGFVLWIKSGKNS